MTLRTIAAVAVLLAASVALADHPHDAVCQVSAPPYGGSGTLVGFSDDNERGIVLTCWHVINEGNRNAMTCTFPAFNKRCRARMLGYDEAYDIAALEIDSPPNTETPRIVVARKDDGPFVAAGFPWNGGGKLCWTRGEYVGYPSGNGTSAWARSMLHTRTLVISGYSGGARFNQYGEYCGVVSGMTGDGEHAMDKTWGCAGPALIQFVGQWVEVSE